MSTVTVRLVPDGTTFNIGIQYNGFTYLCWLVGIVSNFKLFKWNFFLCSMFWYYILIGFIISVE